MFFSSWLRNWHRSAPAMRRRSPTSPKRRASIRPQLEALEDRLVPSGYAQINLVGVQAGMALSTDSNLNGWGMTSLPAHVQVPGEGNIPKGSFCVANTFTTGEATFYDKTGHVLPETINVPSSSASTLFGDPGSPGHPTGVVYNPTNDFVISEGDKSAPATLIFDSIDGTISGWNPEVDATHAILMRDTWANAANNNGAPAVYTGLEIGQATGQDGQMHNVLYATDFLNNQLDIIGPDQNAHGKLTNITPIDCAGLGVSHDLNPSVTTDPTSWVWSVSAVGDKLIVTFADLSGSLGVPGGINGGGAVDVFDTDGNFVYQIDANDPTSNVAANATGRLENPWGVSLAPANFGMYSNDLLVGNVWGPGHINAYQLNPTTGRYEHAGQLDQPDGTPIAIKGLWDMEFDDGPHLFFDAGPNQPGDSTGGLFGVIAPAGYQGDTAVTSPLLASGEQLGAAQAAAWEQALYALAQAQSGKKN